MKKIYEILYFIAVILILLIIVCIFLMIICAVKFGDKCELYGLRIDFKTIEFSAILSLIGIFGAGSVVLPKVFLRREVKECVLEEMENTVKDRVERECQQYIELKFNAVSNNQYKIDAHISRMISFLLCKENPLWSIGWAFRSLKSYNTLLNNEIGLNEYVDFVFFLKENVIIQAVASFYDEFNNQNLDNELNEKFVKEGEFLGLVTRTVKDIIDFEYSLVFSDNTTPRKDILFPLCKEVAGFSRDLCGAILQYYNTKKTMLSSSEKNIESYQLLTDQILQISQYGYTENMSVKNDFSDRLKKELKQIQREKNPGDGKEFHKNQQSYFFFNSE